MKTKVIVLDWQWVTLRSWCQMNRNGHSSPVMHNDEGKPHEMFEKLKQTSGKSALFGHFLWSILGHLCSHLYFSWSTWFYSYTSHMSDFVLILSSLYLWIFGGSALALGHASEEKKTRPSIWFQGKANFFKNLIFNHFYESHWHLQKLYSSHKFTKYLRYGIIFFWR